MLHVTCDLCGKGLEPGENHFVVKIEVFPSRDPSELTEADLDEDHMEAISDLLRQMEADGVEVVEPAAKHLRYDLCDDCRQRFVSDPLNKQYQREQTQKFDFSEN